MVCRVPYPRSRTGTPHCHLLSGELSVVEESSRAGPASGQSPVPGPIHWPSHCLDNEYKNYTCQPETKRVEIKRYLKLTGVTLVKLLEARHQLRAVSEQLLFQSPESRALGHSHSADKCEHKSSHSTELSADLCTHLGTVEQDAHHIWTYLCVRVSLRVVRLTWYW